MKRDTDKKIIFRKIRGRVVPIKISRSQYEGAGQAAGGVAVAGGGGGLGAYLINRANRTVRYAGRVRAAGKDIQKVALAEQMLFGDTKAKREAKFQKGFEMRKRANKLGLIGRRMKIAGLGIGLGSIILGESMIERGVEKVRNDSDVSFAEDIGQNILSGSLAAGAAFAGGRKTVGARKIMNLMKARKRR